MNSTHSVRRALDRSLGVTVELTITVEAIAVTEVASCEGTLVVVVVPAVAATVGTEMLLVVVVVSPGSGAVVVVGASDDVAIVEDVAAADEAVCETSEAVENEPAGVAVAVESSEVATVAVVGARLPAVAEAASSDAPRPSGGEVLGSSDARRRTALPERAPVLDPLVVPLVRPGCLDLVLGVVFCAETPGCSQGNGACGRESMLLTALGVPART